MGCTASTINVEHEPPLQARRPQPPIATVTATRAFNLGFSHFNRFSDADQNTLRLKLLLSALMASGAA